MRLFLAVLLCAIGLTTKAQNIVYDENAELRSVAAFTGIEVSGALNVFLSQGDEQGVAISAGEEKYNCKIKTEVTNGILHISVDGGIWNGFNWTNKKLKAYVTVKDLSRLEVSGASIVSITGPIKTTNLNLEVSGASEIRGIINVQTLNMQINGASVARLSGSVADANIEASGACKINSYDLSVDLCKARSSGASVIRLTVNKELNAEASGGSNIYYKGAASVKAINASGGSSVKNRSDNNDD